MDRQTGRRIFKLNMTYAGTIPTGGLDSPSEQTVQRVHDLN